MAALDDLKALVASSVAAVENLKADVADLISKLPAAGGLTSDEVETLRADLQALKEKAEDAADDHEV